MGGGASRAAKKYKKGDLQLDAAEEAKQIHDDGTESVTIRFISINDVYELDNFPHFKNVKKVESVGPNLTVVLLAGDFVAPSLLSSLDRGFGMVDCMNRSGVDFVCFGNHEDDIPLTQLHSRIRQSKFTWINSNMQSLPLPPDIGKLPEYVTLEASSGSHKRRVALLGLNTEDPSLYCKGSFGGCTIEPLNKKAASMYSRVMETEKVDTVVPMTHQSVGLDRELASMNVGFPVIIGGHDHEVYQELIHTGQDDCHIIKTGMDAVNFAVIDLTWQNSSVAKPTVSITLKQTKSYDADPDLMGVVEKHKRVLGELERAVLFPLPDGLPLSSQGIRLNPSSMATFLLSTLRNILGAQCAVMCGGNIRADHVYNENNFTYSHLKSEFPFDTNRMVTVRLPGSVIAEAISYTRSFSLQSPPVSKGCYLQADDSITWDRDSNKVLAIAGRPFEPHEMFCVAVNIQMLEGVDSIVPVVDYIRSHVNDFDFERLDELAIETKHILVGYFAKVALHDILTLFHFDVLDRDGDGLVTRDDLLVAAKAKNHGDASDLIVNNIFNIADRHHEAKLTKLELLTIYLCVHDELKFEATHYEDKLCEDDIHAGAKIVLGSAYDPKVVEELMESIDVDHHGYLSHADLVSKLICKEEAAEVVI